MDNEADADDARAGARVLDEKNVCGCDDGGGVRDNVSVLFWDGKCSASIFNANNGNGNAVFAGRLQRFLEEIGVVDCGAAGFVEFPGLFATFTGGEIEFGTMFGVSPGEHGLPESATDALPATSFVGDKIFEIGDFADDWPHDDRKRGDANDFAAKNGRFGGGLVQFVDCKQYIVGRGSNKGVKPFFRDFSAVFFGAGELN